MTATTDNKNPASDIWLALALWAAAGFALGLFGLNLRFFLGLGVLLLEFVFLVWTAVMVVIGVVLFVKSGKRRWPPLATVLVVYPIFFFGGPNMRLLGDRIVFEINAPRFEQAVADIEGGAPAAEVCRRFLGQCSASQEGGLRMAWYHDELFDKHLAYVYDPTGVYGNIQDAPYEDRRALAGELIPNVPMFCRTLRAPYYRCFFS